MVVGEIAQERDLIIIGGGPGGYNAAIRAAQLGLDVTLVEKADIGGVCLNKGCIPSKVYTHSASKLEEMKNFASLGIEAGTPTMRLEQLQDYKASVVANLRKGVEALCKANKVEVLTGSASFLSDDRIGVEEGHNFDVYHFKKAIIATGSTPVVPEGISVDNDRIFNSHTIFDLANIPEHLIVYGSDYIALEMAMSFHQFGAKVSVVLDDEKDAFPFDDAINRELQRIMKKAKIKIYKKHLLKEVNAETESVSLSLTSDKGAEVEVTGSHLFVSYKNIPNTASLGIDRLGMEVTEEGFIKTNNVAQSSLDHIFAIGDAAEGPQLAVKAIKEGKVAAETLAGIASEVDLTFIPTVVHTTPPIATVGLTEAEAKEQGYDVKTSQFSLSGNGYATILGKKDGFAKIVSDKQSELILGVHVIGAGAVELITSGSIALEMVAREEDMKFPLYPHPSMNEGLLEAVEALQGQAIHLPPTKQKI
jgi:dihydrolipoamide dehydrogenase